MMFFNFSLLLLTFTFILPIFSEITTGKMHFTLIKEPLYYFKNEATDRKFNSEVPDVLIEFGGITQSIATKFFKLDDSGKLKSMFREGYSSKSSITHIGIDITFGVGFLDKDKSTDPLTFFSDIFNEQVLALRYLLFNPEKYIDPNLSNANIYFKINEDVTSLFFYLFNYLKDSFLQSFHPNIKGFIFENPAFRFTDQSVPCLDLVEFEPKSISKFHKHFRQMDYCMMEKIHCNSLIYSIVKEENVLQKSKDVCYKALEYFMSIKYPDDLKVSPFDFRQRCDSKDYNMQDFCTCKDYDKFESALKTLYSDEFKDKDFVACSKDKFLNLYKFYLYTYYHPNHFIELSQDFDVLVLFGDSMYIHGYEGTPHSLFLNDKVDFNFSSSYKNNIVYDISCIEHPFSFCRVHNSGLDLYSSNAESVARLIELFIGA